MLIAAGIVNHNSSSPPSVQMSEGIVEVRYEGASIQQFSLVPELLLAATTPSRRS